MSARVPAILGGKPLFERPRPIGQFAAPPLEEVFELLDRTGQNQENLVLRLENELAARHDVPHCVAVSNAGLGMTLLMRLLGGADGGEVVMPAFTFRGLPHFARWAGFEPRFCDVEETTHALDPAAVAASITAKTRAILSVCNFNDPGDIDGLSAVAAQYDIPLLFDSVYATGSTYGGKPLGRNGIAEVFSLHATKLVNGFEGGYITTRDAALASRLRDARDAHRMPFASHARSDMPALDCGLHRVHAATALCSVAHLSETVDGNRRRYEAYESAVAPIAGLDLLPYRRGEGEDPHFELTVMSVGTPWPFSRDETLRVMRAEGAVITAYYSPPLHRPPYAHRAFEQSLPVTDVLATRYMQLPGGELMTVADIEAIGTVLAEIAKQPDIVRMALREHAS